MIFYETVLFEIEESTPMSTKSWYLKQKNRMVVDTFSFHPFRSARAWASLFFGYFIQTLRFVFGVGGGRLLTAIEFIGPRREKGSIMWCCGRRAELSGHSNRLRFAARYVQRFVWIDELEINFSSYSIPPLYSFLIEYAMKWWNQIKSPLVLSSDRRLQNFPILKSFFH